MNMTARSAALMLGVAVLLSGCGGEADAAADKLVEHTPSVSGDPFVSGDDAGPAPEMVEHIEVEAFADLITQPEIRLINVRSAEEVVAGMIPGAQHIPLDRFDPALLDLSDGRTVVLYCRSGHRSGIAAIRLGEHVGKPVAHLDGGILAWQASGRPLIQP